MSKNRGTWNNGSSGSCRDQLDGSHSSRHFRKERHLHGDYIYFHDGQSKLCNHDRRNAERQERHRDNADWNHEHLESRIHRKLKNGERMGVFMGAIKKVPLCFDEN